MWWCQCLALAAIGISSCILSLGQDEPKFSDFQYIIAVGDFWSSWHHLYWDSALLPSLATHLSHPQGVHYVLFSRFTKPTEPIMMQELLSLDVSLYENLTIHLFDNSRTNLKFLS